MDIERINRVYRWMVDVSQQWFTRNGNVAASQNDIVGVKNDLFFICQDTQKTFPLISSELFRLKDTLFLAQGRINPVIFGEVISWLRFLENTADNNDFWNMIHPTVEQTSRKLFEDGHYANASEDAFIEINSRVKKLYTIINPESDRIPDGVEAMNTVFSANKPMIRLADNTTDIGKNIQKGYM